MPQMMPLNWMVLMIVILLLFISLLTFFMKGETQFEVLGYSKCLYKIQEW